MKAPHPAALGRVLRVMGVMGFLVAPFLITAALQVKGVSWRYERSQLTEQLARERQHRRHLVAEHARLTAPDRLREQAARLGLVPSGLGDGSTIVVGDGEGAEEGR